MYTMEYSAAIKRSKIISLVGVGSHHSQQTNTGTENQIPYVFTYKLELKDENTSSHCGEQISLGTICWGVMGCGRRTSGRRANGRWA